MDGCADVCRVGEHVWCTAYREVLGVVTKYLHDLVCGCGADVDGFVGRGRVSGVTVVASEEWSLGEDDQDIGEGTRMLLEAWK